MIFDKFKGINAEREVKKQEKSNLEKLLEVGDKIIRKYRRRNHDKRGFVHMQMCLDLKKKGLDYNEEDLISYVHSKSNQDLDEKEKNSLGHYTGCLLELLTEKNTEQGKRTQLYINGNGNRFEYLFYFARKVDELIVDNFHGYKICCGLGAAGKANSLVVMNCIGFGSADEISAYGGKIGMLVLVNNFSNESGLAMAYDKGKAGLLLAVNNKSEAIARSAGGNSGLVDLIIVAKKVVGGYGSNIGSGMFLANGGRVNTFISLDCKEKNVAQFAAKNNGRTNLVLVANNSGTACTYMQNENPDNVNLKKLVIHNSPVPKHTLAKKLVTGEKAEKEYLKIIQKYKTAELVSLAESLSGKSKQEMFDILGKIRETYESTK